MLNETDLSRVDLNLLTLFEAVMATRHVGRAAQRLNLSPSAVSHGLGRLRRLLDDPVFIRTPKGVTPTDRATELAGPIADALRGVRGVIASVEPFDPARSARRFTLSAPDGISAVVLSPLLARLAREAPGIALSLRQLLPERGEASVDRAWRGAFEELDGRTTDLAIVPTDAVPARFRWRNLFEDDFVLVAREKPGRAGAVTLDDYCAMQHLLVSATGEASGFVDDRLAEAGRTRRIALTVPNFMFALAVVAETELVCAVPRRFAEGFGARFRVVALEPPLPLGRFRLNLTASASALADAGLAWLFETLAEAQAAD